LTSAGSGVVDVEARGSGRGEGLGVGWGMWGGGWGATGLVRADVQMKMLLVRCC
jgi:hypothetical protein